MVVYVAETPESSQMVLSAGWGLVSSRGWLGSRALGVVNEAAAFVNTGAG
ncbi:MAG: hypothetical protein JRN68_09545 [Nitrososphaerota archaeon]|nr:hypothetical protein [Nitrososphaerota archaeon]